MSAIESLRSFAVPARPVAWLVIPIAAALMVVGYGTSALLAPLAVGVAFWVLARSAGPAGAARVPRGRWFTGAVVLSAAAAVVPAAVFALWTRYRLASADMSSPYVPADAGSTAAGVTAPTFAVVAVVLAASAWFGIALGAIHARHGLFAALGSLLACAGAYVAAAAAIPGLFPGHHMGAPVPGVFVFLPPLTAVAVLVTVAQTRRDAR